MKIRVFLIIVPLITLALALAGGYILIWRLFILSVLVLLLSYLWTYLSTRGLDSQAKKVPECCQVGEYFDEEFTVFSSRRIPTPLIEVQEDTDLPGHHNMVAFNLSSQSSYGWHNRVYCQRRGQYHLGALTARVSDPFGFFSLHRNLGEHQNILVHPATLELPSFQLLSPNELQDSRHQWSASQTGPNAARVREYISGDSLNHIHWRSTAHTGTLMVKVFEQDHPKRAPQNKNVWVILNMQQASQLGEGDETTEEYSIIIAASLVKKYIDSGKPAGLIASGDQPYLFLPEVGDQHLLRMLDALALMKATGKVPVDRLISQEMERFEDSSAVIVITPSASEGIAASLHRVIDRDTTVTAILLDSVSFGGAVTAVNAATALTSIGIPIYSIRRGTQIARALDSQLLSSRMRYMGDVA
jgi:uncharacterized protein (DUF58 family)